jgi:hypothetical protein
MISRDLELHDGVKARAASRAGIREKQDLLLSRSEPLLQQYYGKTHDELASSGHARLASNIAEKRRTVLETVVSRPGSSFRNVTTLRAATGKGPLTLHAIGEQASFHQLDAGGESHSSAPSSALHALSELHPSVISLTAQPLQEGLATQAAAELNEAQRTRRRVQTASGARKRMALSGELPLPKLQPPSIRPGRTGPREFVLVRSAHSNHHSNSSSNSNNRSGHEAAAFRSTSPYSSEGSDAEDEGYASAHSAHSGGSLGGSRGGGRTVSRGGAQIRVTVTHGTNGYNASNQLSPSNDGDEDFFGADENLDASGNQRQHGDTAAAGGGGGRGTFTGRRPPPMQHQPLIGRAYEGMGDYTPFSHAFRDRDVVKELGSPRIITSARLQSRRAFRRAGEVDVEATATLREEAAATGFSEHPFVDKHSRIWRASEPDVYKQPIMPDSELLPIAGDAEKRAQSLGKPYLHLPARAEPLRTDGGRKWAAWSTPVLRPHTTQSKSSGNHPLASPMRTDTSLTASTMGSARFSKAPTGAVAHATRIRNARGTDPAYALPEGIAASAPQGLSINVREFARTGIDPLALVAASRDAGLARHVGLNATARAVALDGSLVPEGIRMDEFSHSPYRDGNAWRKRIMETQAALASGNLPPAAVHAATTRAVLELTGERSGATTVGHSVTTSNASAAELVVKDAASNTLAQAQHDTRFRPHSTQAGGWVRTAPWTEPGIGVPAWAGKPPDGAQPKGRRPTVVVSPPTA